MGVGERPAAGLAEFAQAVGAYGVGLEAALAVPELADVVVVQLAVNVRGTEPAKEDVAGGLDGPLALHDALAIVAEAAGAHVLFQGGGTSLLDLQDQRVGGVLADEHDHPAACADAADAHDLAGNVHDLVAAQQLSALQR